MATRTPARRRPNKQGPIITFIKLAIIIGVLRLIVGGITWSVQHPAIGAVILALLIAAALGVIRVRRDAKEHQRAVDTQQAQVRAAQSMEIARYHAMGPREFEEAVAYLCQRDGCTNTRVVGGAGDLGADVLATAPDGRRIVIQCKRYGPTTKVGSQDLQRFGGTCYTVHGAQIAAVVTTSVFTRPAADYGTRQGIRLYDQTALAGWATRTGPAPWM